MISRRFLTATRSALVLTVALFGLAACGSFGGDRDARRNGGPDYLLGEAERQMELGAYQRAIEFYQALEVRHPFAEETRTGQLGLMYAYYKSGKEEEATDAASKFIRENPRHPRVDYAYYMRGLAWYPQGLGPVERLFRVDAASRPPENARRSFSGFADFLQRYPDSEWAADARQRMIFLRNLLAEYEINVARFYLERKGYVAALNRAQKVVTEFQGTPSVNDALALMAEAYRRLDKPDLAQDAERVLRENQ